MGLIKVNYDKAYQQARRLQEAVQESESACKYIDSILRQAPAQWRGESEKQFELELRQWKKEQLSIQKEMESLAKTIRMVADEFKAAEERIAAQTGGKTSAGHGGGGGGGRGF